MIRAGRTIKKVVEMHLEMDIREYGAIRLGDDGFYVGKVTKRTLLDPENLLAWIGEPHKIEKAVRVTASNVRMGVLRGIAKDRGVDESFTDTFFEETVEEEQLKKVPESRAKWVQELTQGERR